MGKGPGGGIWFFKLDKDPLTWAGTSLETQGRGNVVTHRPKLPVTG